MLFFNSQNTLSDVSLKIFRSLDIGNFLEGDSVSYLNETYYEAQTLGTNIKISRNNYDYEDDYEFMISIKKAIGKTINSEKNLYAIAEIISSIISIELDIVVALEKQDSGSWYLLKFINTNNNLRIDKVKVL